MEWSCAENWPMSPSIRGQRKSRKRTTYYFKHFGLSKRCRRICLLRSNRLRFPPVREWLHKCKRCSILRWSSLLESPCRRAFERILERLWRRVFQRWLLLCYCFLHLQIIYLKFIQKLLISKTNHELDSDSINHNYALSRMKTRRRRFTGSASRWHAPICSNRSFYCFHSIES